MIFSIKDGKIIGTGTGFVYQEYGTVVTCAHVVSEDGVDIMLRFSDEDDPMPAKVVLLDSEHDIALLSFDDAEKRKTPLEYDDTDVAEGKAIIFSGYPLGINDLTTHQGIISSKINDDLGMERYSIDGSVNPGNSGGPLMSIDGKVIGIINATRQENAAYIRQIKSLPQVGAVSILGLDLIKMLNSIVDNLQLGIGYAVPAYYIPKRATKKENKHEKR